MENKLCECGCGLQIEPQKFHKYKAKPVRFITGHFQRTAEFKEMKRSHALAPDQGRSGFCECGCGGKTEISTRNSKRDGEFIGQPKRFIHGHHNRIKLGPESLRWKGGRIQDKAGYWKVYDPGHHLANLSGYLLEHRLVWENANGRRLTKGEIVHHIDGNKSNNDPSNLVAMNDRDHRAMHVPDSVGKPWERRLIAALEKKLLELKAKHRLS